MTSSSRAAETCQKNLSAFRNLGTKVQAPRSVTRRNAFVSMCGRNLSNSLTFLDSIEAKGPLGETSSKIKKKKQNCKKRLAKKITEHIFGADFRYCHHEAHRCELYVPKE